MTSILSYSCRDSRRQTTPPPPPPPHPPFLKRACWTVVTLIFLITDSGDVRLPTPLPPAPHPPSPSILAYYCSTRGQAFSSFREAGKGDKFKRLIHLYNELPTAPSLTTTNYCQSVCKQWCYLVVCLFVMFISNARAFSFPEAAILLDEVKVL